MKIFNQKTAIETAKILLEIKAVKLSPSSPFTWASGMKSPIYCDNRKILSYPESRKTIKQYFADFVKTQYPDVDVIAGVATGAIAVGALVADLLDKPFIYIRSASKKHGLGNQIEGVLNEGETVLVIEDLISTGMSSLDAVKAIRDKGNTVLGMLAIFTYGLPVAIENFKKANCRIDVLSNFDTLISYALETNYISESELKILNDWKNL